MSQSVSLIFSVSVQTEQKIEALKNQYHVIEELCLKGTINTLYKRYILVKNKITLTTCNSV